MAANSSSTSSSPLAAATTIDLLRFSTAGSVDDGKSTLIGRMLYDSRSVYEDQIASVRGSGFNRSAGPLDFSLLTDGLRAEREQGITIDVAYRYFSTSRRRFIIADTPGHEQYTRNMATGASTADAALVLVDATQGMLVQSRRHLYIAFLLGIRHIVAAINKMDLAGYDRHVFDKIACDFSTFARQLGIAIEQTCAVPVSALQGDNVVHRSLRTPWYQGPTLLDYLEHVPVAQTASSGPLRFPVQYVIRPDSRFRGFAGQVVSGALSPGLPVAALPSGLSSRVKSLVTFHGELDYAGPGTACTVTLEDQIDLGRGDLLAPPAALPQVSSVFRARLLWLHPSPSRPETFYFLKHTTRTVRARFNGAFRRVDVTTLERSSAASLAMNEIAECEVETTQPLFFDPYCQNRTMGSFILIDPISNATVAAGMIEAGEAARAPQTNPGRLEGSNSHPPLAVWMAGDEQIAHELESVAFSLGWQAHLIRADEFGESELAAIARVLHAAGAVAIFVTAGKGNGPDSDLARRQSVQKIYGESWFFPQVKLPAGGPAILDWLRGLQTRSPQGEQQ